MKVNSYAAPYREESQGRNVTEGEGTVAGIKYMDRVSGGEKVNLFHEAENSATIEISEEGLAKKDTALLAKAVRFAIDWEVRAYRENPQPFEEEKQKQLDWKRKVDNTKLEVTI